MAAEAAVRVARRTKRLDQGQPIPKKRLRLQSDGKRSIGFRLVIPHGMGRNTFHEETLFNPAGGASI
jgi:hypothetical protein